MKKNRLIIFVVVLFTVLNLVLFSNKFLQNQSEMDSEQKKINGADIVCIDGDTFWMGNEKFRLLYVNTPEISNAYKVTEEPLGQEAKERTCDLLKNSTVKMEIGFDDKKDKYGRYLVNVWINDVLLQKILIQEGLATVLSNPKLYENDLHHLESHTQALEELLALEQQAQQQKIGIWDK